MNRFNFRKLNIEQNTLWGGIAIGFTLLLLLWALNDTGGNTRLFSQIVAGGLYQGMLIFMVAAGLSIVFGLMDVLNFAQGSLLMVGAYIGFDVLTRLAVDNETNAHLMTIHVAVFTPLLVAILVEITEKVIIPRFFQKGKRRIPARSTLLNKIMVAVLIGAPLGFLFGDAITRDFSLSANLIRILLGVAVTLIVMVDASREIILFGLRWVTHEVSTRFQRGLALMLNEEPPPVQKLQFPNQYMNFDWDKLIIALVIALDVGGLLAIILNGTDNLILRLGIAAIAATFAGTVISLLIEIFLIRPTYIRPFFQIVLTFGVALVIEEAVEYYYGPTTKGTLAAFLPPSLRGTFPPEFLRGVFPDLDTTVFNYWIFMIIMGLLMMIGVQILLMRTRIGIIIRAGVQDSEMVEALGVNVRLVFTAVFALGGAIAALGGIISAGFISVDLSMGNAFLLQAIAVVIIGGLGSYAGTALASIVVGITRSVTAYFSQQQFNTTAVSPVAVLILLCIVLMVKPSGLFGREH